MFKCNKCSSVIKGRWHECGQAEFSHPVEIIGGGGSWGNPRMGVSGNKDSTM